MPPQASIQDIFLGSFVRIWAGFASFIPRLVGALLMLLVGWMIAVGLQGIVVGVLRALRIDQLLEKMKVHAMFERSGIHFDIIKLLGWLVKWFFVVVFLITAANILEWNQVTTFLQTILFYIPNVIIAVIILFTGMVVAQGVHAFISGAVKASGVTSAGTLASLSKWSIVIFSFLAALTQLGIASELIQILFTGLVFMLAIAGGVAFGLGGKEEAQRILQQIRKDLT